ncbi:MAG: LytTR family DNA-binding domain-containing protein [Eubacteriales bacterium]|nr:LytTR family DNA-binding domain-containing protein [Eubacteriales bacterium]
MLRVAVVEDEKECRDQLGEMLEQYGQEHGKAIKTSMFSDGQDFLESGSRDYDVIFLDIEMPRMNGLDTARAIRKIDKNVVLVFITNIAQYAINGYEVEAFDFILKPVNYFTFSMRFSRAAERVKNRESKRICLNLPGGPKWLESQDIWYVETQNRMLHYHTNEGIISIRGALKDVSSQLEECHFVKCNHCYLVNLKYVTEIRGVWAVVGGDELEISRRNRNSFLAAITDYMGNI